MLKKTKTDSLYQSLLSALEKAGEQTNGFEKMSNALASTQTHLKRLNELLPLQELSPEEEITFFKETKPIFYQWLIYHMEMHTIDTTQPFADRKALMRYYQEQLNFYQRFFTQNAFLYQYYKLKATEMDHFYFIRGAGMPSSVVIELPVVDQQDNTSVGYLFAKFMAYEKLISHIQEEIKKIVEKIAIPNAIPPMASPMKWTGDKTNLVELIYGLFYTGQLNHGNATVADIIKWMEDQLQIDLSRSYKNFIDIKNRKRDSPTKFLDKMKDFILQRIDEDNTYRPNRGIKLMEDRGNK